MNKKIRLCSLVSLSACAALFHGQIMAYPVLTYSGTEYGLHFTPEVTENAVPEAQAKALFLHIYKGQTPDPEFVQYANDLSAAIDPNLKVMVLTSNADWQAGLHRVIVGPVPQDKLEAYRQTLKEQGVDNFPIFYLDDQSSAIAATAAPIPAPVAEVAVPVAAPAPVAEPETEMLDLNEMSWENQYATGEANFIFDQGGLTSASADVLVSFATERNSDHASTWFFQPGIVVNRFPRFDSREYLHLGLGYRQLDGKRLFGFNTMVDATRTQQRISIGAEYSYDFLRLSANYYLPLSAERDSADTWPLLGNQAIVESPASSFDVYASVYYPTLPWVSLDMSYQKFFGDYVETTNFNTPVSGHSLFDIGIGVQPIPLVSLRAAYVNEQGDSNGMEFSANIIYRFGVPLEKQLDYKQVAMSRALNAQLMELIKRNNNIRLKYNYK